MTDDEALLEHHHLEVGQRAATWGVRETIGRGRGSGLGHESPPDAVTALPHRMLQ